MTTATLPPPAPVAPAVVTLADLVERLGGIPLERIRFSPRIGTATVQDVIDIGNREKRRCELIDGVLVEKAMGAIESMLALWFGRFLSPFVQANNLGFLTGADGSYLLMPHLVRIPDIAFVSWNRVPSRKMPTEAVPNLVPDLAIEILSKGNTPEEMLLKRQDYFAAGVSEVWEVDAGKRIVTVYPSGNQSQILTESDTLDGGTVLPGFTLPLAELFGELDRHG